ncbi:MAG: phosphatidylserine decarboxylase [Acidobacteriota bacterium]
MTRRRPSRPLSATSTVAALFCAVPFCAALLCAALSLVLTGTAEAQEAASPCQGPLDRLATRYELDPATQAAFQAVYEGLQPLPPGYWYHGSSANPWASAGDGEGLKDAVIAFYAEVCTLLPQIIGTNDNALDSIQYFAWFYFRNDAGRDFVEGIDPNDPTQRLNSMQTFLIEFNRQYKAFMNSPSSTGKVAEWIADPRIEIQDYVLERPSDYASWNAFFARELKQIDGVYPSRPVTMPNRDYVIVSPTDCIMNPLVQPIVTKTGEVKRALIENPLQRDTVLDVKGIPMSIDAMLANAPEELKKQFDGGSGLACVLMPNTYHHFHSPVDGTLLYAEIVEAATNPYAFGTFGYSDWPNWVPLDGNVGRPGTDFSQFEGFQRGVLIVEVQYKNLPGLKPAMLTGLVASIPVGLDTVGSVVFADGILEGAKNRMPVRKGITEFGNFYFGGSLNILLFSPVQGLGPDGKTFDAQMVSPAVQTRMGNQIGILNTPYPAPPTPWTPNTGRTKDRPILHGERASTATPAEQSPRR